MPVNQSLNLLFIFKFRFFHKWTIQQFPQTLNTETNWYIFWVIYSSPAFHLWARLWFYITDNVGPGQPAAEIPLACDQSFVSAGLLHSLEMVFLLLQDFESHNFPFSPSVPQLPLLTEKKAPPWRSRIRIRADKTHWTNLRISEKLQIWTCGNWHCSRCCRSGQHHLPLLLELSTRRQLRNASRCSALLCVGPVWLGCPMIDVMMADKEWHCLCCSQGQPQWCRKREVQSKQCCRLGSGHRAGHNRWFWDRSACQRWFTCYGNFYLICILSVLC